MRGGSLIKLTECVDHPRMAARALQFLPASVEKKGSEYLRIGRMFVRPNASAD